MTVFIRGRINARNEWVDTQEIFRAPYSLYTPSGSHYGTRMVFDKQGFLYFSIGERGQQTNAQNLSIPLGKIHRVKDDGSIPADNPFVNTPGAIKTLWTIGNRNAEGLSYDPRTGLLWESEHGPTGGDEINVIVKGHNYGWGVASMGVQPGITKQHAEGMDDPVAYYTPTQAPSGINFYSGTKYPGWKNSLFVSMLAGQNLRRLEVKDGKVLSQEVIFNQFGRTRHVITGPDGLLYILIQNPTGGNTGVSLSATTPGMVIRLVPTN
jgi:glucose/arabinose dehydrogenase